MKAAPWIVLGIVASAIVGIAVLRGRHAPPSSPTTLPAEPAIAATSAPAPTVATPSPRPPVPNPEALAQARADRIRSLESHLVDEARDAAWASRNERRIDAFFAPDNLRKAGVPEVASHEVECRSQTCRIRMRIDDDLGADQTTQALLQHVAESLPSAQIFQTDDAKGADIVVFAQGKASTAPGPGFGPKR